MFDVKEIQLSRVRFHFGIHPRLTIFGTMHRKSHAYWSKYFIYRITLNVSTTTKNVLRYNDIPRFDKLHVQNQLLIS